MKVNVDTVLKSLEGEPLKFDTESGEDWTVKRAAVISLHANDPKADGKQKLVCDEIAQKIFKGGEVELSASEIAKVQEAGAKLLPTRVYAEMHRALEGSNGG